MVWYLLKHRVIKFGLTVRENRISIPPPVFIVGILLRYMVQYLDTRDGTTV